MFAKEALGEIERWRQKATAPQHQLDWRWIERYRQLDSFDAYWWWAQAGPFTEQEQRQWDYLCTHTIDDATKEQLANMLAQSCQREVLTALAQQREPRLHYPALDIEEVRHRIAGMLQLDAEISQEEPNAIVRRLYHEAIEDEVDFLRMFEATYEGNTEQYWELNRRSEPEPTPQEMQEALLHVRRTLRQGLHCPETVEVSQQLTEFLQTNLQFSLDGSSDEPKVQEVQPDEPVAFTQPQKLITAQTAKRFFERALRECGYEDWQVMIDPKASAPRVEQGLRQLFLQDSSLSIDEIRHYFAHEVAGHVARFVAGERPPLGLLGIGTKSFLPTEEGLAYYQERQIALLHEQHFNDVGTWLGTLATGLASGVVAPAQTFRSLCTFFELFFLLRRLLRQPKVDMQTAQQRARNVAMERCLRTYRGVPDLEKAGVCFTKDAVYLRGLWQIERAVAQDETVFDRLAVGVVALAYLPDLQELGIVSAAQPLKTLASDPALEAYILSCEEEPTDHLAQLV